MKNYSTYQSVPGTGRLYDPFGNLLQPVRETLTEKSLSCDVVFGSPSNDCRGTGICKITARKSRTSTVSGSRRDCKSAKALLISGENGRSLSMVFARELLCVHIWKNHLRHGVLVLNEPCKIPLDVSRAINLKFHMIQPGQYKVEELEGRYRIRFSM
ncbi:MAG TPA: hypothetical protein PLO67_15250 [Saprospiraceae bacterium]|nr:hypothetical protein [Saprospiraceae bacterium]HPI07568.1 hypothetical protein [Saprospiraceae bacterium]